MDFQYTDMTELTIKALYTVGARRVILTPGPSMARPCPYLAMASWENNQHAKCQSKPAFVCILLGTFNDTSTCRGFGQAQSVSECCCLLLDASIRLPFSLLLSSFLIRYVRHIWGLCPGHKGNGSLLHVRP